MRMSLTKLKLTSQCKNDTPYHLELGTVINDICPHHQPQLPSQTHAYLPHSEADSSSECLIPFPFSSSGRFEGVDDPIPYTLQCQDEATINDYNLIAKQHFSKVNTCYVIPRPSSSFRSKSGPPTDHNPIVLHLSVLAKSAAQNTAKSPIAQEFSPRTQFHSYKLKDPAVRGKFSHALEDQADKAEQAIQTLKNSLQQGSTNATQYAENANAIIVSALQVTAQKIIGTTEFRCKNAQKEHLTQRRQHDNGHFWCVRCWLITDSPKTPSHYRYQI